MKKQSLSLLAFSLMTALCMSTVNAGTTYVPTNSNGGGLANPAGGIANPIPGTTNANTGTTQNSNTGTVGRTTSGTLSSFGTVVTDPDLTARIPGKPKKVNGAKVTTGAGGTTNPNATTIPSKSSSGNLGYHDSTSLTGEGSFSQGPNHKMEEFQTTKTRTKPADPSELYGCAQGYLYDLSKGGCYLPDPECPGNPIKKVWDKPTLTCVCPVATPTWNGISCLAPCGTGQVFDGVSCVAGAALCTPSTQTQTIACGTGFTGNKMQVRSLSCPANTWSAWVDSNISGCVPTTCTPSTNSTSGSCGVGYIGSTTITTTTTCSSGTPTVVTTTDTSGCSIDPFYNPVPTPPVGLPFGHISCDCSAPVANPGICVYPQALVPIVHDYNCTTAPKLGKVVSVDTMLTYSATDSYVVNGMMGPWTVYGVEAACAKVGGFLNDDKNYCSIVDFDDPFLNAKSNFTFKPGYGMYGVTSNPTSSAFLVNYYTSDSLFGGTTYNACYCN